MALLDQIRLLDRLMVDAGARERFRQDPAAWLGGCDPADALVLGALDRDRLAAAADELAAKVLGRWYWPRFQETLVLLERALGRSPHQVVERVMAGAEFSRRTGEDETAVAFCSGVLDQIAPAEQAAELASVLVRDYLIAVGLPRRSAGLPIDRALEARLFPAGVLELPAGEPGPGEIALAHPLLAVELPAERLLFLVTDEGAIEVEDEPPLQAVLVAVGEAPCSRETLVARIEDEEEELVGEAIDHLVEHGLLARGEGAG